MAVALHPKIKLAWRDIQYINPRDPRVMQQRLQLRQWDVVNVENQITVAPPLPLIGIFYPTVLTKLYFGFWLWLDVAYW